MHISPVDWPIVAAYFALSTGIGLWFTKRGGESLDQYFLSGRQVPWWLAGAAMVATTFAADTPLVVTGLVATKGVAGNWLWWNFVMSGMLTVFFFARLWRRANVMTDVELPEVRSTGICLWWILVRSGSLTFFFSPRLWRRANVMTDVELAEVRYSGKAAAFLRGFRAIYLAIPINLIILGW